MSEKTSKSVSPGTVAMAAALSLAVAGGGPPAQAATSCSSTQVKTSNFTLSDDYETTSDLGPCFRLEDGANLDLNGHTITCTDLSCSIAVQCADNGSKVESGVDSDDDHVDIDGPFDVGTEDCTIVKNLVIEGAGTAVESLANADQITGNVLRDCADRCIDADMTQNSDKIKDNLVDVQGGDEGIRITGKANGDGPRVHQNIVRTFATTGIRGDATHYRIDDNIIVEGEALSEPIDVDTGGTLSNNACDGDDDCTCDLFDPTCLCIF